MTVERVTWNHLRFTSKYSGDIVINFNGFYILFQFGGDCIMLSGYSFYFSEVLVKT